jgi:hypothetical protein
MILVTGLGEVSYLPDTLSTTPQDYVDVDSLAFLQCYARELLHWEVITFFADHLDEWCDLTLMMCETGHLPDQLIGGLEYLAGSRLLESRVLVTGPEYRLTAVMPLRRAALRVSDQLR